MFELLPGVGVVLPRGAGLLRFGMSERQAQWALSTVVDVRAYWSCAGTGPADDDHREFWSFGGRLGTLRIDVTGSEHGCRTIAFEREPGTETEPVAWRDVDVFGYPAVEVEAALPTRAARAELGLILVPESTVAASRMARARLSTEDVSAYRNR
ncbi:hypothetical protein [Embleya scabrispora]|uniref:hypothetical protein n=1 Tax=Embleya scabrispora TaxID=159449 RepID=UPI00039C32D7|nr:hypothetical protein [Embleya scabrispora]MYS79067.1 hypothetical protein [Streptomyces sp. SID5474]